jgi:hypothetical protein
VGVKRRLFCPAIFLLKCHAFEGVSTVWDQHHAPVNFAFILKVYTLILLAQSIAPSNREEG